MNNFTKEARNELERLRKIRETCELELGTNRRLEKSRLKRRVHEGVSYFSLVDRKSQKERYLGKESNETVRAMQKEAFYRELQRTADYNISIIERLVAKLVDLSVDAVRTRLPGNYRNEELYQLKGQSLSAKEWLSEMKKKKGRYRPYKPEELKHTALDGTKVRSKGEMGVANFLIEQGVCYIYECPIETPKGTLLPDFTIYVERTGEVIYWEHSGMLYVRGYYDKQFDKIIKYESIGVVLGKNLIVTVDRADGTIDTSIFPRILAGYLT